MAVGDTAFYRYIVVVGAVMFLLALVHVSSKPGRAWASIRESEPAALAAGVNITLYKMWAFALASFITGVAGCLLAAQVGRPARDHVPDPGLADAGGDCADRRHLQPLGRGRRRHLQPAAAVPLPGAVGHQLELPADPLRRRPPAGAADRAGRPRRAVPEGHGESRPPRRGSVRERSRAARSRRDRGRGLTVRFAGVTPIDDMSVVFPGGTCGLIGPNGAGKTTFFNVLSGFVKPAAGSITAFGENLLKMADFRRARWGLRRTFQTEMAIEQLSVFDNVAMIHEHSGAKRASRRADVLAAIEFVGLDGVAEGEGRRARRARAAARRGRTRRRRPAAARAAGRAGRRAARTRRRGTSATVIQKIPERVRRARDPRRPRHEPRLGVLRDDGGASTSAS